MLDWLKEGKKYKVEILGEPAGLIWHEKLPPKKRETPECLMCQEELVKEIRGKIKNAL